MSDAVLRTVENTAANRRLWPQLRCRGCAKWARRGAKMRGGFLVLRFANGGHVPDLVGLSDWPFEVRL